MERGVDLSPKEFHSSRREIKSMRKDLIQTLPRHFVATRENTIITTMGRFTLYPGDEIHTADPRCLVVLRGGNDYRIAWDIISGIELDDAGNSTES